MLTGRPGARSAVPRLGAADPSSDARDGGPLDPRLGDGRGRPGAYLDMKVHLEKNLEEERKILMQQQKIFRNRARKYFVESNQRKKYFEEKQKEQEEREHEIREQILQQRKQKFEEVTEKFQRAHIPLSQRRRPVFQKPVPPLEEALKQIQESNLKSQVSSSYRPTINLRAIDNALTSSLSKNDQKHLLSKINCDKEVKENSRIHLPTKKDAFQLKLMETQKLLEDQHLRSLQKFCDEVNQITNSETLSSIDSLEAGEHEQIYSTLTNKEPPTTVQENSVFLKSANLRSANLDCFDKDKLSFSKTQHINNWLKNLDNPNTQTDIPFSDILSKPNVLPSGECFNSKEQNPSALCRAMEETTNANNILDFICNSPIFIPNEKIKKTSETSTVRAANSCSRAFKRERPAVTESPTFKCSKAWGTPDPLTQEMATISDQVKYSELTQENRATSIPTSFVPVASLVLPSNTQSTEPLPKNIIHMNKTDPVQCSDNLGELKDDKKIKCFNSKKEELPLFSDNFLAACIPHNSDKKQKITETSTLLSNVISNYDLVGQQKKRKYNIDGKSSVRFLKSILKKESKYEHDSFKALVINQGFKLRNQKAEAIRDSIELTKEKGGNAEIPKTIKKLRWVDETEYNHSLKNGLEISQQWSQSFHTQTNSGVSNNIISVPACAVNSANRKNPKDDSISENLAASGESRTNHVSLNCFIPSAFNIAKQAWPASEKEESKSPIHNSDSKTQKANVQRGREKVIRTKSAQVQSGFLYTNRKGTVIRAQSANKANTFLQPQGKLVPHPPKTPPNIRSDKNTQVFRCQSEMPENSQNIITNNYFTSKHVLPAEHKMNQWNKVCGLPLSHVCSNSIPVMPSLPYCSECQTLAKTNHSNGTQIIAQQDGTLYCTQRCPVYEESQHSVAFRPTKEESVPSWKRWHNSLGQNEKAADSTIMRRKRIVENKQRNLLEQRKQNLGSVGQKCSEQMNNFGQRVQLSSSKPKEATLDTSNIEEVSDSTSEFLMAENLVKSSVTVDDILSVMSNKQLQKTNLALNKTQQLDICALSAEEQKVLQSLNRLNERLFYVQATICKNPSIKNALQIMPLLNMQPRTSLSPNLGSRLHRKY
ncbi:centrosomal protein of 126 kDa isoform X1 [Pipistrellus kuhlii]|uniref:Centrosomal protein 126 n=3 Tax=Pipistrellus kuhlii TaxID=59472 RepID=A0A7J7WZ40_PIPKU|nr:centrosomal protein of 126 kDa isoform X1 [Pipistrellus kuhlii]KAF6342641.1 centrosomal protein 126 [Pipistrellus kuhlii]